VTSGSVDSKLNHYFNSPCFTTPSVTGADGIGSAFGDSGTGIANGPSQANGDFSLSKTTGLTWPREDPHFYFVRNSLMRRTVRQLPGGERTSCR